MKHLMSKVGMKKLTKVVLEGARKNAPTIMCVGAVIGFGATVYSALKAKPKADDILKGRREKVEEAEAMMTAEEVTPEEAKKMKRSANIEAAIDMAKVTWRPVLFGMATVGLIFGANHINLKRLAYLGAAYKVSQDNLKDYQDKVKEVVGEKKEAEVRGALAKERVAETWNEDDIKDLATGKGQILYLDYYSGRYFRCSKTAIEAAVNVVNRLLNGGEMFVSLNTFYKEIGLDSIGAGEEFGFDAGTCSYMREPTYTYTDAPNGDHCIVMEFDVFPRSNIWG